MLPLGGRRFGLQSGRRPAAGGRGLAVGGGGAPFDPLADVDLVALFMAEDATDNGTVLTVPNRVVGGGNATASGVGRPSINATGLDGISPAIDFAAHSVSLTATLAGLATSQAATVIFFGQQASGTTASYLWRYGSTVQDIMLRYHTATTREMRYDRRAAEGTFFRIIDARNLLYPSAVVTRHDMALATEDFPIWVDGALMPDDSKSADLNTSGSLSGSTMYIGANSTGAARYQGVMGGMAVLRRALTDEEVGIWTTWFRQQTGFAVAREFMWCGDSITAAPAVDRAAWVKRIQTDYDAEGDGIRFYRTVGPLTPSTDAWSLGYMYAGGGWTTQTVISGIATYGIGTRFQPAIMPILIGTNDFGVDGVSVATLETRMDAMVDALAAALPSTLFILQKILPRTDDPTAGAKITDWNDNYHDAFVATKAGEGINIISDDTLATLPGITYADLLHPDAASGNLMGDAMYPRARTWAGV